MKQAKKFNELPLKDQFKAIQILHLALMIGTILPFTLLWFFQPPVIDMEVSNAVFGIVLPFLVIGAAIIGTFLSKKNKERVSAKDPIVDKLANFRSSGIIRWALIEGASLMSFVIFFMIEPNILCLIAFAFGLFALAVLRPTVDGFATEYGLSSQERDQLA